MKELKDKLKAFRSEFGKPITKMTAEEMEREISHHETAKKTAETKAKRLEALAKAREAKKASPHLVVKEKAPVKTIKTAPLVAKAPLGAKAPAAKKEVVPAKPIKTIKTIKTSKKKDDEYSEASSTDHDSEDSEKHETIKSRIQKKD
jgi:hypothetical protein